MSQSRTAVPFLPETRGKPLPEADSLSPAEDTVGLRKTA